MRRDSRPLTLLRREIDQFRSTGKWLMPEGLEKDLSVTECLIRHIDDLSAGNRRLAIDAMLRDTARIGRLLDAVAKKKVSAQSFTPEQVKRLQTHADE